MSVICSALRTPGASLMPVRKGFTLIELLVVVTIIVVLLALLTPALDSALRESEMALCGANIKGVMNGAIVYTGNYRRYYPRRPVIETYSVGPFGWLNDGGNPAIDDRKVILDYIPINAGLNCPLNTVLDIAGSQPSTYTYSDYDLWFGFYYVGTQGMRKHGDKLRGVDYHSNLSKRYDLLVSDVSDVHVLNGYGYTTHPDDLGAWPEQTSQDSLPPWGGVMIITANATLSWYSNITNTALQRGGLDLNYGYQDGSVSRIYDVQFHADDEERMNYIPSFKDPNSDLGRRKQVPAN
jgi:prepilin-type N-terminal cleavage/methylation domain-containing protein